MCIGELSKRRSCFRCQVLLLLLYLSGERSQLDPWGPPPRREGGKLEARLSQRDPSSAPRPGQQPSQAEETPQPSLDQTHWALE
ncbi:unnamed protein product [Gadus morhua 'NCC']